MWVPVSAPEPVSDLVGVYLYTYLDQFEQRTLDHL